jgi:hypothetical protein
MTTEEIRDLISAKRQELNQITRSTWGAPRHIAEAHEPRIQELNAEIHELKAQLYKENGGKA